MLLPRESEPAVVGHTGPVHDGVVVNGLATAATGGLAGWVSTFGTMLVPGTRAAQTALEAVVVDAEPVEMTSCAPADD